MSHLTLAISSVGDLLEKSRVTKCVATGTAIEPIELVIPEYQRPYKWTTKTANQLLDDIIEAQKQRKNTYRLGTLILHHDTAGKYNIVDGQQRLITLALLLVVLGKDADKVKLLNSKLPNNEHTRYNIYHNYHAFLRRLRTNRPEGTEQTPHKQRNTDLLDYILHHCELIVVITEDIAEAFQFFDSQNARGKELYPHDLLKAYHLREANNATNRDIEAAVAKWEEMSQAELNQLFGDYLYRLKCWMHMQRADSLTEQNIEIFKGVSSANNNPYSQYYKGAFAYSDMVRNSMFPFVFSLQQPKRFLIEAPVIAGLPFFHYAKYYFDVLQDIKDNNNYEGVFITNNPIVSTLDANYNRGTGNLVTRLMFNAAILLYIDRFCAEQPSYEDLHTFDRFLEYAFIWAYSMRAQYKNVGWYVAQNFILGTPKKQVINAFNIYREIVCAMSPHSLISTLADLLQPLAETQIKPDISAIDTKNGEVQANYLFYFKQLGFIQGLHE